MTDDAFVYDIVEPLASAPDGPPTPARALASFARLDHAARGPAFAFEARPVTGCSQRHLDVHIHDVEGKPLAGVPVTLDFPEGAGRQGTTDTKGLAHFGGLYVDVARLTVEIDREWPIDADAPTYRARVVEAPPPVEDEVSEPPPEEDEPMLYHRPWDDPVEPEDDDEDAPSRLVAL